MKTTLFLFALLPSFLLSCSNDDEKAFDWESNGLKIEKGKVIAYFPKDSLTDLRMNQIVDSIDLIITASLRFIDGPHNWQVFGDRPITYYFRPGRFISVTDVKGDIYIPLYRIKNYQAPVLHETMHALLRTKHGNWNELSQLRRYLSMPVWFTEGLAEYISVKIEVVDSIKKFDIMGFGGYYKVDSTCSEVLIQNRDLISYIGEAGIPTKFVTDRRVFAPQFYTCSCSFTKYLAETYGLGLMLEADSAFQSEEKTIEALSGKNMQTLKKEWVSYLNTLQ